MTKYELIIGRDRGCAGYFNDKQKTLILPVFVSMNILNNYINYINAYERTLFISGCKHTKINKKIREFIFVIKIKTYKQLLIVIDATKDIYHKNEMLLDVKFKKECKEFLK